MESQGAERPATLGASVAIAGEGWRGLRRDFEDLAESANKAVDSLGGGCAVERSVGDAQVASLSQSEGVAGNHGDAVFANEPFG